MQNGVTAGDLIVEVNNQLLGDHFSEEDLLILLTELERPITIGFKRSGLELDSDYDSSEYDEGSEEEDSNIIFSPITPMHDDGTEQSQEATTYFESMKKKAVLSPNTPTTAELRISQDSPGMFIEQARILKASPNSTTSSDNVNNRSLSNDFTNDQSLSYIDRSPSGGKSMLGLMRGESDEASS